MKVISISEGRRRFSKVVNDAANGEPQIITKNGVQVAVIVSYREYRRLKSKERATSRFSKKDERGADRIPS